MKGNIVELQSGGSRPPFFCVHAMNGSLDGFERLCGALGPDQPFYGIRSPFLEGHSLTIGSLEELAELYVTELKTIQPHGPYYLGGYSMGGRVAFAMAQQLEAAGEEIGFVVLLDSRSYVGKRLPDPRDRMARYWALGTQPDKQKRRAFLTQQIDRRINKLRNSFMRRRFRRQLARHRKTGKRIQPSPQLTVFLNKRLNATYQSKPWDGRAILFKVDKTFLHSDVHDGWKQVVTHLDEHTIGGRHLTILQPPFVNEIAGILGEALEAANKR